MNLKGRVIESCDLWNGCDVGRGGGVERRVVHSAVDKIEKISRIGGIKSGIVLLRVAVNSDQILDDYDGGVGEESDHSQHHHEPNCLIVKRIVPPIVNLEVKHGREYLNDATAGDGATKREDDLKIVGDADQCVQSPLDQQSKEIIPKAIPSQRIAIVVGGWDDVRNELVAQIPQ